MENAEDDWTHDPVNPRNWTNGKKWIMVSIVRVLRVLAAAEQIVTAVDPAGFIVHFCHTPGVVHDGPRTARHR